MDVFEEENSSRAEIPGLPDSERGNKKGRKKGNNSKKTLSLQNFLQDENQEPSNSEVSESRDLEAHFAKLNLDEEELIVMESCHSYIHDLLRQLGPTNAMDPILQQEMNGFPPDAKRIIQKCGGYRNFILRSKDLAVVDKIVAAKSDLRNAQEMAFKEIYNNLPPNSSHQLISRNDHNHQETTKEIWNSKSNLNKSSGNLWGPHGSEKQHDQLQLEVPRVDSLFNDQKGNTAVYYQTPVSSNLNQDQEFSKSGNGILPPHNYSAQQNLLKGLGHMDPYYTGETKAGPGATFTYSSGNQLEECRERIWKLQEENQELQHRVADRDQLFEELTNLRANFSSLEALQNNTKNDFLMAKSELEQVKADSVAHCQTGDGVGAGQRQDIIFSLQKALEAEQLRNLNLTQELENKKQHPPAFYSSVSGPWNTTLPASSSMSLPHNDGDLLGLRSMIPGPWSGDSVSSQSAPAPSLLPPPSSLGSSSFLQGGHGNHMFGGLGLATAQEFQPILGVPSVGSPGEHRVASSPSGLYTQQQPSGPQQPPPTARVPAGKTARQEMLVKKLVSMLPPGTPEETIKHCIQVLRARNGKLSGWPTSKIAGAIEDLLQSGECK